MARLLAPGRIFWAADPGKRGDCKIRPMIIASRVTDILKTGKLVAVDCSTTFKHPIKPEEVLLPLNVGGRGMTNLPEPTVAVCNWTVEISASDIIETTGLIPNDKFRLI